MEILLAFGVIWVMSRRATIENERSKIMIGRIRGFRTVRRGVGARRAPRKTRIGGASG